MIRVQMPKPPEFTDAQRDVIRAAFGGFGPVRPPR